MNKKHRGNNRIHTWVPCMPAQYCTTKPCWCLELLRKLALSRLHVGKGITLKCIEKWMNKRLVNNANCTMSESSTLQPFTKASSCSPINCGQYPLWGIVGITKASGIIFRRQPQQKNTARSSLQMYSRYHASLKNNKGWHSECLPTMQ